jgi:protein-disulfide isomerase
LTASTPNLKNQRGKAKFGLASLCLALVVIPLPSGAQRAAPVQSPVNWAMGRADARVTLLEYGSLTCTHCAEFSNDVFPALKQRYVDTGRVRYVFRPFPTPPNDLSVAMHALTLCAGPNRYYGLLEAFFARQRDVFAAAMGETGPKGTIFAIAEDFGGLTYAQSEACLRDTSRQTQVLASAQAGSNAGVTTTPSLFVNGTLVGNCSTEAVSAALDRALSATARAPAPKAKKR